jgi:hypothetical protein
MSDELIAEPANSNPISVRAPGYVTWDMSAITRSCCEATHL